MSALSSMSHSAERSTLDAISSRPIAITMQTRLSGIPPGATNQTTFCVNLPHPVACWDFPFIPPSEDGQLRASGFLRNDRPHRWRWGRNMWIGTDLCRTSLTVVEWMRVGRWTKDKTTVKEVPTRPGSRRCPMVSGQRAFPGTAERASRSRLCRK